MRLIGKVPFKLNTKNNSYEYFDEVYKDGNEPYLTISKETLVTMTPDEAAEWVRVSIRDLYENSIPADEDDGYVEPGMSHEDWGSLGAAFPRIKDASEW